MTGAAVSAPLEAFMSATGLDALEVLALCAYISLGVLASAVVRLAFGRRR